MSVDATIETKVHHLTFATVPAGGGPGEGAAPGTFRDRVILTDSPDRVLEGLTIGARATGAALGLIYLRAEYSHLHPLLEGVINDRPHAGLTGQREGGG